MTFRPRRSALYLPASRASAIKKARTLPCDVVIFDLEDAVSPEQKDLAREMAVSTVIQGGFGKRELIVRINGQATLWGQEDVQALKSMPIDGLLTPKINCAADIQECRTALGNDVPIWAMIETCAAILNIREIVENAQVYGLAGLVLGTNDLALEMRCHSDQNRTAMLPFLSLTVAAARMARIAVIDGVFNSIEDESSLSLQCAQGKSLGFDGKSLIHPSQITIANSVFSPTKSEMEWSNKVVSAFAAPENQGKGVLRVEGKMTELLHLEEAQRILSMQRSI